MAEPPNGNPRVGEGRRQGGSPAGEALSISSDVALSRDRCANLDTQPRLLGKGRLSVVPSDPAIISSSS